MKKHLLLLALGAATFAGAVASPARQGLRMAEGNATPIDEVRTIVPAAKAGPNKVKLPVTDPITNPEGELHAYYRHISVRCPYAMGFDWFAPMSDMSGLVYFNGDKVYFYDLIPWTEFGTYVEGTIVDNNKIVVELPQTVTLDYGGAELDICMVKYDGKSGYTPDLSYTSVTFDYDPVKDSIFLNLPGQYDIDAKQEFRDYGLGLVYADNGEFTRYVEMYASYTKLSGEYVYMPTDANPVRWTVISNEDGTDYVYNVKVADTDEYVYIQGFFEVLPEGTIRAKKNGDGTATIYGNQKFGVMSEGYVTALTANSEGYLIDSITVTADMDKGIIRKEDKDTFIGWTAYFTNYVEEAMNIFEINRDYSFAGYPSNPTALVHGYVDSMPYGSIFQFDIPLTNTEGGALDVNSVYYRIYIDGEEFEFVPNDWDYEYMGLPGPTFDIPFTFDNDYDIVRFGLITHDVVIYVDGMDTLGVQTIYRYEGRETRSDIVTKNLITGEVTTQDSGVDTITVEDSENVYYDLYGRRVQNPAQGIYIRNGRKVVVK